MILQTTYIYTFIKELINMKLILLLILTYITAPVFGMITENQPGTPPVLWFHIIATICWCHELLQLVPDVRSWFKQAFEKEGKPNYKTLMAAYFSLMCIRIFTMGKMTVIFYHYDPFTERTYDVLTFIILILIGYVVVDKILDPILKKFV